MKKVVIIGSGLSGLSCAHYLKQSNFDVHIFEKESKPGGRASSEKVDEFICDKGFQVLLNNYSELNRLNIYKKLNLKNFNSGAFIYTNNKILSLYNPIYHPIKFIKSNIFKIFKIKDIYSLLKLLIKSSNNNNSTKKYIDKNFSTNSLQLFFYPFFRGIFLSPNLENNLIFFKKFIKKFAFGIATLPAKGMSMLSHEIIKLSNLKISFNYELIDYDDCNVTFSNGEKVSYDILILAMPLYCINKFKDNNFKYSYNSNSTFYFSSSKNLFNKTILLVPQETYEINSIQCISNVSSNYSSNSRSLYSVSTLNADSKLEKIMDEFQQITKIDSKDIKFVKSYKIKNALPKVTSRIKNTNKIFYCGDWSIEPSIDGAIKSGRLIAEDIIKNHEAI